MPPRVGSRNWRPARECCSSPAWCADGARSRAGPDTIRSWSPPASAPRVRLRFGFLTVLAAALSIALSGQAAVAAGRFADLAQGEHQVDERQRRGFDRRRQRIQRRLKAVYGERSRRDALNSTEARSERKSTTSCWQLECRNVPFPWFALTRCWKKYWETTDACSAPLVMRNLPSFGAWLPPP